MTVCKHCGTEIEDGLEYCPNCGQSIDENLDDFFNPDEYLEEEAYNIFDAPEEFDMDSLLDREFEQGVTESKRTSMDFSMTDEEKPDSFPEMESFSEPEEQIEDNNLFGAEELSGMDFFGNSESEGAMSEKQDDLVDLFGLFGEEQQEEIEELSIESKDGVDLSVAEEADFLALDDLFQDLETKPAELNTEETEALDQGLEDLLAASEAGSEQTNEKAKKAKKHKKEKKSLFQTLFGNVPVDPSKIKQEPTPEELAAKKQKEAEEKKAKAEEKKLADEEKKQIAQQNKEEKARQKALAKEEKKARKLKEAKLILEEMQETRINRMGATIVFVFFAVIAVVLLFGSDMFGYAVNVHSAETNFNKAYNNNVKYYTDAYNDIYGLKIKEEDQLLNDKIMTVMFVNKELNSYNSQMRLGDYESALHSLLLGLYRYGVYYGASELIPLDVDKDLDYVREQILKELEDEFKVSEDEAELLRSMLEETGVGGMNVSIDSNAAREYNQKLYEIVKESGLKDDSNN